MASDLQIRRGGAALIGLVFSAALLACRPEPQEDQVARLSLAEALGPGSVEGFSRALEPRPFEFPSDLGPHLDFRTEWWYLTGNLATTEGRHFGFQATFFRTALRPRPIERESAWATNQLYMAHFALTDTAAGDFHSFERFGRGAQELAGARAEPFAVWLEDWELAAEGPATAAQLPPLSLRLDDGSVGLELRLSAQKPLVLHGDNGLSRKGPTTANASYYYSSTRLEVRGTVRVGEVEREVSGSSWMDREWSSGLLETGTTGWDWLALQLDDGTDLMYFRLRGDSDRSDHADGTLVDASGEVRRLDPSEVLLEVLDRWQSPESGAVYPSRWRLRLRNEELDLEIRPRLAHQEIAHSFVYWEGAVTADGHRAQVPLRGRGYVELTGYGAGASLR